VACTFLSYDSLLFFCLFLRQSSFVFNRLLGVLLGGGRDCTPVGWGKRIPLQSFRPLAVAVFHPHALSPVSFFDFPQESYFWQFESLLAPLLLNKVWFRFALPQAAFVFRPLPSFSPFH